MARDHFLHRQRTGGRDGGAIDQQIGGAGAEIHQHRSAGDRHSHLSARCRLVARVAGGCRRPPGRSNRGRPAARRMPVATPHRRASPGDAAVVPEICGKRLLIEQQPMRERLANIGAINREDEANGNGIDLLGGVRQEVRGRRKRRKRRGEILDAVLPTPWRACRSRRSTGCRARCARVALSCTPDEFSDRGSHAARREARPRPHLHRIIEHQEVEIRRLVRRKLLWPSASASAASTPLAPTSTALPRGARLGGGDFDRKPLQVRRCVSKHDFENGDCARVPREERHATSRATSSPHRASAAPPQQPTAECLRRLRRAR